jgi:hypothetical protein
MALVVWVISGVFSMVIIFFFKKFTILLIHFFPCRWVRIGKYCGLQSRRPPTSHLLV